MKHVLLSLTAGLLTLTVQSAFAANTGGYATTDGGDISGAVKKTAHSMQDIIEAARVDKQRQESENRCISTGDHL